jgi:hypothetical protein
LKDKGMRLSKRCRGYKGAKGHNRYDSEE